MGKSGLIFFFFLIAMFIVLMLQTSSLSCVDEKNWKKEGKFIYSIFAQMIVVLWFRLINCIPRIVWFGPMLFPVLKKLPCNFFLLYNNFFGYNFTIRRTCEDRLLWDVGGVGLIRVFLSVCLFGHMLPIMCYNLSIGLH